MSSNQSLTQIYTNFIGENWKLYVFYILTQINIPIQNLLLPHYYSKILDSLSNKHFDLAKRFFGILLIIWVIVQILGIGISYVDSYLGPRFHSYIRQYFFELILDRYNIDYQELKIGSILTKLIKLPWLIDDILHQIQRFLINNSILVISTIYYLAIHHYSLALIYAGSIAIIVIVSKLYYNACNNNIKMIERLYDNCHEEIEDTLQNLLSIYTSQKIDAEKSRIADHGEQTQKEQIKGAYCNRRYRIYFSIINVIIFIALNYASFTLYQQKLLTHSGLTSIFIINFGILKSLMELFNETREFMNIRTNIELIQEFISSLPKEPNNAKYVNIPNPANIRIELKNIVYYHDEHKEPLYNGLNLIINPREKVAIMGSIGSGKSTFAKLITRLQTYEGGTILINGISIDQININDLRKNIIYIPQHPKLFNRTLWENISYGLDKSTTADDIYKFLEQQNMHELSRIFRERMNESVGKQGSHLSGGQRQMVWLIRAVMKNCPVVILDEPSASLDPTSSALVHKMIQYIARNKTVILITHDKDLTKGMDRLIYFDTGKITKDVKLGNQ